MGTSGWPPGEIKDPDCSPRVDLGTLREEGGPQGGTKDVEGGPQGGTKDLNGEWGPQGAAR